MEEKIYKIKLGRLLSIWIAPVVIGLLVFFLAYADSGHFTKINVQKFSAFAVLLIIFIGPFIYLFFNHLKFSTDTQLKFFDDQLEVTRSGISFTLNLNDITEIIEYSIDNKYSSGKLLWGDIIKWKISYNGKELVISSLTISKSNFKKYFKKEVNYKFCYFPTV